MKRFAVVLVMLGLAMVPGLATAQAEIDALSTAEESDEDAQDGAQATIEALQTETARLQTEVAASATATTVTDDGEATESPTAAKSVNVELIVDASGSMAQTIDTGETRMDAAKRVLNDVITGIPD